MIDLRSDLFSAPTDAMWDAMRSVELGWATFGEDPSVNLLTERVAELLGKQRGLWVPTCGMANLVALLIHCERGDAVVLESSSHVMVSESLGIVDIAGLEPAPLDAPDGRLEVDAVAALVEQRSASLLVLENTHTRAGGTTMSVELTAALAAAARRHGCKTHLDGARLVNAAAALGATLADLSAPADTVALSLNKGLSVPFGTILAGSGADIERAQLVLRQLGGASMHKAGLGAAAGLVALDSMLSQIPEDNRRAGALAALIAEIPGLSLDPGLVETNIVLVDITGTGLSVPEVLRRLGERGVRVLERDERRIRLVTHGLIGDDDVDAAAAAIAEVAAAAAAQAAS